MRELDAVVSAHNSAYATASPIDRESLEQMMRSHPDAMQGQFDDK